MRIEHVILKNFRLYEGENKINFIFSKGKNISLIAGKNGFGKTTFLTSLIWGLYGNLMSQVEDKYRRDIKSAGGYEGYLQTLLNRNAIARYKSNEEGDFSLLVELKLIDVMIPTIPCREVIIRRSYNYNRNQESVQVLIDGEENKLTKTVGYDVFINDFILPREIAKFFFFDAEKIVSLAEAKSKVELRALSKAYSEVLGIKKYEDLRFNLNTLLTKLRREGVKGINEERLQMLVKEESELEELVEQNLIDQRNNREEQELFENRLEEVQEKLVREGNMLTLEQLNELKDRQVKLKDELSNIRKELKRLMDVVPLAMASSKFDDLVIQLNKEMKIKNTSLSKDSLENEFVNLGRSYLDKLKDVVKDDELIMTLKGHLDDLIDFRLNEISHVSVKTSILLDFDDEVTRSIISTNHYVKNSFKEQFERISKREKSIRQELSRIQKKIRNGEARKDNHLANRLRSDKDELDAKLRNLGDKEKTLISEYGSLKLQWDSKKKVLNEYEKNYSLIEVDRKKYAVTESLLAKLNVLIRRIKEEKKFSLQKSIELGLQRLMHKNDFIAKVKVRIEEDVMDVDLLDQQNRVIDKDSLSKGEQQLYATVLLKALVDESGIDFPVFIDSPLQKFDKEHSNRIIEQFYPTISDQVVLFPLLGKELSEEEYNRIKPNLSGVYLISNSSGKSSLETCEIEGLFEQFNSEKYVL